MSPDKLVYVANQVATFFKTQPGDEAAAATLNHLERYWEPRMRREFLEYLAAGGEGMSPVTRQAAEMMAAKAADTDRMTAGGA
jgi:formate dehydrogenase subunit delta